VEVRGRLLDVPVLSVRVPWGGGQTDAVTGSRPVGGGQPSWERIASRSARVGMLTTLAAVKRLRISFCA
jgi:hypothetical protein